MPGRRIILAAAVLAAAHLAVLAGAAAPALATTPWLRNIFIVLKNDTDGLPVRMTLTTHYKNGEVKVEASPIVQPRGAITWTFLTPEIDVERREAVPEYQKNGRWRALCVGPLQLNRNHTIAIWGDAGDGGPRCVDSVS